MPKPIAYLDADILLHRAVSFVPTEFDGEEISLPLNAMYYFDELKKKWLKEVGPVEDYFLVVSVGKNFRHELYKEYKANRKDIKPHPAFSGLKKALMELDGVIWEEGIEADDLIGIKVTESKNTVAVSADKDFATIPCTLYVPASHGKTKGEWHTFTEAEANRNWMLQCMTGDVIDNYKGIPRCGPKTAEKIVPRPAPLPVMWQNVELAFKEKLLTREYALTMARLARILRHGDYNFETKEVTLWTPK